MYFSKNQTIIENLSINQVQSYVNYYFPTKKVEEFKMCPLGSENISIKVTVDSHPYLLRISTMPNSHLMNNNIIHVVEQELKFMSNLFNKGISVPRVFKTILGQQYVYINTEGDMKFIILMEWIDGVHREYDVYSIIKTAQILARIHQISLNYVPNSFFINDSNYSAFSYRLIEKPTILTEGFPLRLYEELKSLYDIVSIDLKDFYFNSSRILIHSDVKADNLLWKENTIVGIIDFGDIRYSVIPEDLGVYIWDMCIKLSKQNLDIEKYIDIFLSSYSEYNHNFTRKHKELSVTYAIDRFLSIHLHYLIKNQTNSSDMKYQINKAEFELDIINKLLNYRRRL
ncbi:phosphotransferase [Priestia filamentosa]|uniref:phosphotransferase n=1 Tax=Priestia filamentosa TaxID=1402861 RepID=UPI001FB1AB35|nr:phosphotransferase [Priestia filamentosa]UOE58273.1 phosphotransferase [Priestia filamentosa]